MPAFNAENAGGRSAYRAAPFILFSLFLALPAGTAGAAVTITSLTGKAEVRDPAVSPLIWNGVTVNYMMKDGEEIRTSRR
ncbi:MAG: hypothetical protein ABII00_08380, partial [Elusimicrobiota bacterium]